MKNVLKVIRIDDFDVYLCRQEEISYSKNNKFIIQDKKYEGKRHESVVYDLLTSADKYVDSCVLYDGNVIDKKVFRLKILDKKMLPVIQDSENSNFVELVSRNESGIVYILKNYVRSGFLLESKDVKWIVNVFFKIEKVLGKSFSMNKFPYLNMIAWKTGEKYYLLIFPRVVHRPVQYYSQDNTHLRIEPEAADLGGCIVAQSTHVFDSLNGELIKNIFQQVAFSTEHMHEIVFNIDFDC